MTRDLSIIASSIESFYNEGLGVRAMSTLRDGALMTFIVDREPLTVLKKDGYIVVKPGRPQKSDLSIEFTSKLLEKMLQEREEGKLRDVLGHCIGHPASEYYLRVTVTMDDDEKSFQDFFWKGYSFWLRRMGFTE